VVLTSPVNISRAFMGSCQTLLVSGPYGAKPFQTLLTEPQESLSELAYACELVRACNILGSCVNFGQCKYFSS